MGSKTAARAKMQRPASPSPRADPRARSKKPSPRAARVGYPVMLKPRRAAAARACASSTARKTSPTPWSAPRARPPGPSATPPSTSRRPSSAPPRRDPGPRRPRREHGLPLRARLLIQRRHQKVSRRPPAPPRRRSSSSRWARWPPGRPRRRLLLGRDVRVPAQRGRRVLLPRDEHAPAGRAPHHRVGRPASTSWPPWSASPRARSSASPRTPSHAAAPRSSAASTPKTRTASSPSPGKIARLRTPSGPWVRDDTGFYEGAEVPSHYDPLISKLSVWAPDRPSALRRMQRALAEYAVTGIKTNLVFPRKAPRPPRVSGGPLSHRVHRGARHGRCSATPASPPQTRRSSPPPSPSPPRGSIARGPAESPA
jgi:acetyl-CoA carboxylase biotin carboxylase subunit